MSFFYSLTKCVIKCIFCHSYIWLFVSFRKPDIQVPYLYIDMGAAVLCASFMSFGVKRRWFALFSAIQLAFSTYLSYVGGHVHYGDWLKVQKRRGETIDVLKMYITDDNIFYLNYDLGLLVNLELLLAYVNQIFLTVHQCFY